MPSGAKRRKAAKKKAAHQPHHHSHEHGDPRSHEEKDSDGGEQDILSPESQEGRSDRFPNDGAEESEDPVAPESKSSGLEPADLVGVLRDGFEENQDVEIVKEVKSEDSSERKTVDIECVQVQDETVEISLTGNHAIEEKASNGGLENGSRVVDKKVEQEEVEAVAFQSDDLLKELSSLPEQPAQIVESSVFDSAERESSVSQKVIHVSKTFVEESPADTAPTLMDQDKKMMPQIDEPLQVSETVLEVSSEKMKETATVVTDEVVGKSASDEKERKLLASREVTIARSCDVVETAKESEKPEPSENKPPVPPAPRVVEKASWCSCCGIFDVITGTSR